MKLELNQVISGGQPGVDQLGLRVAKALGYQTGGMVPKGCRTDDGPAPWLITEYGCTESDSSQYNVRTIWNVRHSGLTVWFGDETSPGGRLTKRIALAAHKWLANPPLALFRMELLGVRVLNIAGNRLKNYPGDITQLEQFLMEALRRS